MTAAARTAVPQRILLAGTARSGSTWVANVLQHAHETRRVYEPDGAQSDVLGAMVATRLGEFPVMAAGSRSYWYQLVWDLAFAGGWPWDQMESARAAGRKLVLVPPQVRDHLIAALAHAVRLTRRRPRHVVVKTVNSIFALDWIAERYAPRVVMIRRNALNIVSSWVALNMWTERPISDDPVVRSRYLVPLGIEPPARASSPVAVAAWNVGLVTRALRAAATAHPSWIVISHDDLCADPLPRFQDLATRVGLQWNPAMADYLRRSDEPGFAVHHGTAHLHPNQASATTTASRRLEQSTQYSRRLTPEQADEARAVLDRFDLGEWGHHAP